MSYLSEAVKKADWKSEKHVPVIECDGTIKAGEPAPVKVTLGKAVAHPNTTEHHIRWIDLYFTPEGGKAPYHIAHFEFTAHGESTEGPDTGPVYTHHEGATSIMLSEENCDCEAGTLQAVAYCNIHGLWESSKEINIGK